MWLGASIGINAAELLDLFSKSQDLLIDHTTKVTHLFFSALLLALTQITLSLQLAKLLLWLKMDTEIDAPSAIRETKAPTVITLKSIFH